MPATDAPADLWCSETASNAVLRRYLGPPAMRRDRLPAFGIIGAVCATMILPYLSCRIDGLLAVALTGAAAARFAATMAVKPYPITDRPRPANDNPFRPVLPPHCFGASEAP